jgi:hypothetical protein
MSFKITATSVAGSISVSQDAPDRAVELALEFVGRGYKDIRIIDANGHRYTPAEFHNLIQSKK